MKRYEKIVFEANEGITLEVSEGTNGEVIIRANVATANVWSENYENPPIPKGYKYVYGKWYNGFVIEKTTDGNQYVWVPVGYLDPNGTLDGGWTFTEKFGKRKYNDYNTPHDKLTKEQIESVKKYGGFYISRYNISKSSEGEPRSVKGVMPWVNITWDDAYEVASTIENTETVKSHMIFGAEYDSVLEWFIKSNARTRSEIEDDSTSWGNYGSEMAETGSREKWSTNHICDFAGNVSEWTQEQRFVPINQYHREAYHIIRGGSCEFNYTPVARYITVKSSNEYCAYIGFRVALWIK